MRILEEDRLILHDLRGVNLTVNFFFGTKQELQEHTKCVAYSICWETVDVRVEQTTITEQICELDFFFVGQQLIIDDQIISGDVFAFTYEPGEDGKIAAFCKIALGKDY